MLNAIIVFIATVLMVSMLVEVMAGDFIRACKRAHELDSKIQNLNRSK